MRNDIVNLRNNLNIIKELNKKELSKVKLSVNDTGDSQKFIEREFENQKRKIKDQVEDNIKCSLKNNDYIMKSKLMSGRKLNRN